MMEFMRWNFMTKDRKHLPTFHVKTVDKNPLISIMWTPSPKKRLSIIQRVLKNRKNHENVRIFASSSN